MIGMRRRITTLFTAVTLFVLVSGGTFAQAAPSRAKPVGPHTITKIVPRSVGSSRTVSLAGMKAGLPSHGGPPTVLKASAYKALRAAMRKPRPAPAGSGTSIPVHGSFARLIGSGSAEHGHAYWNGSRWVVPPGAISRSLPRLLIPRRPSGRAGGREAFPSASYPSTQVDSATSGCSNPFPNEASVAQSSDNPNFVVVAAQAYMDSSGNCDDSHPWVFYSQDGGQHWKEEVMPGLTAGLAGGDVGVVYDPKDHVFVYSFLQFSRSTSTDSINVASSFSGASWFDLTTLAPSTATKISSWTGTGGWPKRRRNSEPATGPQPAYGPPGRACQLSGRRSRAAAFGVPFVLAARGELPQPPGAGGGDGVISAGLRPVTVGDVARLRGMRQHLKGIDNGHGGGAALPLAAWYLRHEIIPLLNGRVGEPAERSLIDVVAEVQQHVCVGRDARRSMSAAGRRNRGTWLPGLPSAPPPRRCAWRVVLLTAAIGGPGKRFDGFAESWHSGALWRTSSL
jgi:hypothetical protein